MERIHAELSVSISELKKNPMGILKEAMGSPVVILNHNVPIAYLIPADTYAAILDALEVDADGLAELLNEHELRKEKGQKK